LRRKYTGLKLNTEDKGPSLFAKGGRRAFPTRRSRTARFGGALGSENVGMSNRNAGEIPAHRKSKVSAAMVINRGLGGPKAKPRGAVDGQSVNIPILPFFAARATNLSNLSGLLDSRRQLDSRVTQGNSKTKALNPKQAQNAKSKNQNGRLIFVLNLEYLNFGFVWSLVLVI